MSEILGLTQQSPPSSTSDGSGVANRLYRVGDAFSIPIGFGQYPSVEEGTYYQQLRAVGTATAATIQTSFSATNCYFTIRNAIRVSEPLKRIAPDYLKLICTTVPASATSVQGAITIDNTTRYSSGGTALTRIFGGSNMESGIESAAIMHVGAVTLAAASADVRTVSRFILGTSIPIANDVFTILFARPGCTSGPTNTAAGQSKSVGVPPIILGRGQCMNIHLWYPGNATTAGQFEIEFAYTER